MFSNRSRHQRSTSASYRRRAHPLVALLKWAVALPIIGYLCVLTVLLVGWQVAPTRFDLFEITNVFALWFCLPLLVIAPLAYGLRLWGSFVGTMVLLLVVVASFGLGMLPNLNRPTLASTTGPLLRVVTHNKLYFTDDTQALARVLLAQDADIIGLQELTGNDKQALDTLLAEHYPYRALDNDGPLGSLGLLSRFPIVSEARVPGISAAHFLLDVYGQPIHVINLHAPVPETGLDRTGMLGRFVPRPTYDATRRDAQLTALVDYTGGIQGPLIMIGDFNLSDREPFYDILNNPLHDSFDEAGWGAGFSFPNLQHRSAGVLIDYLLDVVGIGDRIAFASAPLPQLPPLVRIDYIWTNDALVPLSSRLRCEELDSDHCMLISDVGLLSRT